MTKHPPAQPPSEAPKPDDGKMVKFDLDGGTGILSSEGVVMGQVMEPNEASLLVCQRLMLCGDDTLISLNGNAQTLGDLRDWLSRVVSEDDEPNEPIH
ncbi:hypothetical protein K3740_08755 [Ruegeria conchae]|uniref:hypothetical protein n=1 Tax=Ruegeria conchae TaxID=981384 RepID=UPI0021A7D08F|nr:hypothetical protein [Ruegeria conchae]UWR04750.1 hypothetical protein K3740_08755 [Ruegeria conchae]